MGFQDIYTFSLATLTKQAWQLIKETLSLLYWVYKVRYFPHYSLMEAELGSNPSFVWRSLLQAHDVIREGSVWEVGDGWSISISSHKRLPQPTPPPPPYVSMMGQTKMTWSVRWPTSGIEPSSLPPSLKPQWKIFWGLRLNTRDKLMWKENKPQEFTVKTAYQVALWLSHPPSEEHSSIAQDQRLWKRLWSLNVPPKVWTFMWRAYCNVLPRKSKLARRKVQIDP